MIVCTLADRNLNVAVVRRRGTINFVPLNCSKIQKLREERGLSIAAAARAAGMKRQQWQRIESGVAANVTVSTLEIIAGVLGVKAGELLTD